MAAKMGATPVQYGAKVVLILSLILTESCAVKVSVAHQEPATMGHPVHINFHVHLDGNKATAPNLLHVQQQQQLQCSNGKIRPGALGGEFEATPLATHELQKWISELEKFSAEAEVNGGVHHTILLTSHGSALDGFSLLPGCAEGQSGDQLGEGGDGVHAGLLGLCGARIPELDGLGANNQIEITQIKAYARILQENNMVPFSSGIKDQDYKLGYTLVLLNTGRPEMAVDMLTALIKKDPQFLGAYHARAVAHSRKGLQHPVNAALAIQDFSKAIELDPANPLGWEKRAEVFSSQGRNREAYADISKALDLRPTAKLYKYRGYMTFKEEKYVGAMKDLMESVKLDPSQVDVMHLLGMSLYHQGKMHEAIRIFRKAVELKPDYIDLLRSLAHAYRELGDYEEALDCFNKALYHNPHHVQSIQLRGSLLYHTGRPVQALQDFKLCLGLDPGNEVCRYMKGLCYAAGGQYFEAVKSVTRLMVQSHITSGWLEYEKAKYIRELSRYFHVRLDTPFSEYDMDQDLDGTMRDRWVKNLPFQSEGYKELPGLSPDTGDVDMLDYLDIPRAAQTLLCRGETLGRLSQYDADGFLPNQRMQLAMGLGSLEVAQTLQQHWKQMKGIRNGKRMGWREAFDIAVKWRRYVDPDQPVLWLEQMPSSSYQLGYNSHMNLVRGQLYNVRYASYFDTVFNLTKRMVYQHGVSSVRDRAEDRLLSNLDKVTSCEGLLFLVNQLKVTTDRSPGFMVSTRLDSYLDKSGKLEGAVFTLSGDMPANIMFSINTLTTRHRTDQFQSEIDHIWNLLSDEMTTKRAHGSFKDMDHESVTNLVLSLIYYFYNLMPLSRGSSSVAYTMALGLMMAMGREVTGRIPQGKLVDIEALLSGSPQTFASWAQGWMSIKKSSLNLGELPLVSETFPTLRHMMEALNVGTSFCGA